MEPAKRCIEQYDFTSLIDTHTLTSNLLHIILRPVVHHAVIVKTNAEEAVALDSFPTINTYCKLISIP
jgi:hypothetical protein